MFPNFDPSLLESSEFKEDSVREIIITPMLTRLGYTPSGTNRVTRSKTLRHPFIYAGTRKCPVNLIPDYTLLVGDKPVLVLDAKRPSEDISSVANVQQAYSYAIHPEIKSEHFALCNGRSLAVYNVDNSHPLLHVSFTDFEDKWTEIESYLSPRFLLEPALRNFAPDLGFAFSRIELAPDAIIVLLDMHLNSFMRLDTDTVCASTNCEFAEKQHMATFDFHPDLLPRIVSGLPKELGEMFLHALSRAPFQACADLMIVVDIEAKLGPKTQGLSETFIPFLITNIIASRFEPYPAADGLNDAPAHIFQLSKAFNILEPRDE